MKKDLHRPQRNSSSTASPLAMSLLQYGHLISGNSFLFMMGKVLRPADYPPILRFVSPETHDRRILRTGPIFPCGAVVRRPCAAPVGAWPRPRHCQSPFRRAMSSHSLCMASSVFTSAAASSRLMRGP